MVYETLLGIGALGVAAQAAMGFAHGGGGGGQGGEGHGGHAPAAGHTTADPASVGDAPAAWSPLVGLFSPLSLFSVSLGAGATGLLAGAHLSAPLTAAAAAGGGVLLYGGVVRPLFGLVARAASRPAEALEGAVASEAVAAGGFDAGGKGIVTVTIDGELVRLLAYLERADREAGVSVAAGDPLVVTSIDPKRNTCRVTKL